MSFKRINGIFEHKLKGISGKFSRNVESIDIANIIEINCYERIFCIFDKNHRYSLEIKYFNLKTDGYGAFVLAPYGVGWAFIPTVENSIQIYRRFETEEEMNDEINEIKEKQILLDKLSEKIRNKLLNE